MIFKPEPKIIHATAVELGDTVRGRNPLRCVARVRFGKGTIMSI